MAVTDRLTRLYNRRYLYTEANYLLERARNEQTPLSLLGLDIDKYKQINDRHGHPVGDQVIVLLADLLRKNSREEDLIARFGGEEFVILLPKAGQDVAKRLAETLRSTVQSSPVIPRDAEPLNFTISIGGVTLDTRRETIETALNLADIALYEAKNSGRNCVRFSECQPEAFEQEIIRP